MSDILTFNDRRTRFSSIWSWNIFPRPSIVLHVTTPRSSRQCQCFRSNYTCTNCSEAWLIFILLESATVISSLKTCFSILSLEFWNFATLEGTPRAQRKMLRQETYAPIEERHLGSDLSFCFFFLSFSVLLFLSLCSHFIHKKKKNIAQRFLLQESQMCPTFAHDTTVHQNWFSEQPITRPTLVKAHFNFCTKNNSQCNTFNLTYVY